jgi:hypothetical protein
MPYADAIAITRPSLTGTKNEFGQQTSVAVAVLSGLCDWQDRPYRYAVDVATTDQHVASMAQVFVEDGIDIMAVQVRDDVAATIGESGRTRTGQVVAIDALSRALEVRCPT